MEIVKLRNGVEMPIEGFGVFQVPEETCEQVVRDAISTGYRLIDTASSYQNEKAVGRAIAGCGVPREELFITTKAYIQQMGYENTKQAFQESLDNLGLDYLDLYLIHMPFGDYYGSWRALEELLSASQPSGCTKWGQPVKRLWLATGNRRLCFPHPKVVVFSQEKQRPGGILIRPAGSLCCIEVSARA